MRAIIGFMASIVLGISMTISSPVSAAEVTDFDGVYEATNNLLTTTCTGETTITQTITLPAWYFVVEKGLIDQGLLGAITSNTGTATMTLSSSKLAGVSGVEMTGPVTFTIQRNGTVTVEGTLFSRYNEMCTQTLAIRGQARQSSQYFVVSTPTDIQMRLA